MNKVLLPLLLLCIGAGFPRKMSLRDPGAVSAVPSTAFITGQTLGTLRSDFSEYVGFEITVGGANVTVTHLGRWIVAGNSGTHTLAIYSGQTGGAVTEVATVSLATSGQTAAAFAYAQLATPVTLTAGSKYQIWSLEVNGGDQWYNSDTTVTPTSVATVNSASYRSGGNASASGGANNAFGPVSFKYSSP